MENKTISNNTIYLFSYISHWILCMGGCKDVFWNLLILYNLPLFALYAKNNKIWKIVHCLFSIHQEWNKFYWIH